MVTCSMCWYWSLEIDIFLDHKLGLHTLLLVLHKQHLFEDTTKRADAIIIAPLYAIHANCKQKTSGRMKNKRYCGIYWDVMGWGRHFIYDGYMRSYETDKINEATAEETLRNLFCILTEMVQFLLVCRNGGDGTKKNQQIYVGKI